MIEEITVETLGGHHEPSQSNELSKTTQLAVKIVFAQSASNCPSIIVKPSSLNYKIGLKTAVEEFIRKESKIEDF